MGKPGGRRAFGGGDAERFGRLAARGRLLDGSGRGRAELIVGRHLALSRRRACGLGGRTAGMGHWPFRYGQRRRTRCPQRRKRVTRMTSHRTTVFRCAQLLLIIAAFGFDFAHGILLGEHAIGFHPIYRLRQTLAVAISRLHDPPLHGYLAYQSMVDAFNRNGFASAPGDVGPRLGDAGWIEIFRDPARMDRALQDAVNTTVDTTLAPQLIHDNELGWADYVYLGFRLFGVHMSSLYYFYFLLLGLSSLLFIVAFHRSPFLMDLLLTYLAGIGFMENYVHSDGWQLGTLSNSRLYEALSLLPATHLFAAVWTRQAFRLSRLATIATQSILLAFLVDCRITALWQIAMILAAAVGFMLIDLWRRRPLRPRWARVSWNGVWIAGVAGAALAAHMTMIKVSADRRYATELEYHVVWHEVLAGLLGASGELQREYLGEDHGVDFRDKDADMAVYRDLQRR